MKIIKFTAENIKKLKAVEITPNGSLIEVTGPNGSGKSSVLDAIFYALAGSAEIPSKVIRQGEEKAHVRLDLGELVVTRYFTAAGGTRLTVEAASGARFPSPQRMLDDLIGALSFDPLAFTRRQPREQLEILLRVIKLDLSDIDMQLTTATSTRYEISRRLKHLDGSLDKFPAYPDDTPDEVLNINELVARLQQANDGNAAIERDKNNREITYGSIKEIRQVAGAKRERAAKLIAEAEHDEELARKVQEKYDALPVLPWPVDVQGLMRDIANAQEVNKAVALKKTHQEIKDSREQLQGQVNDLNNVVNRIREERQARIASAEMPVPGLSFTDNEVLYNGLPLNVASGAEKLRVSIALAMAANPKLRIIRVDEASDLDEQSLQLLSDMAATADYQVWLARVSTAHGHPTVVMEDGHVLTIADPSQGVSPTPAELSQLPAVPEANLETRMGVDS